MSKMTKRGLSIVTALAVAFVMSFGCMSVAFADDGAFVVGGSGIKSEVTCVTNDFVAAVAANAQAATIHTLNKKGTENNVAVTGVDYRTFASYFGASKYVFKVNFTATDDYLQSYEVDELTTKDMNGQLPLIIWEKDGQEMTTVGTAFGQQAADDQNNSRWARDTAKIEFEALVKPIVKVTAGKKKVTVKWTQNSDYAGFQVSKATKSGKTSIVAKNVTATKKTISAKKGKNYYYKVRAFYKTEAGNTIYGPWSTAKKCKAK